MPQFMIPNLKLPHFNFRFNKPLTSLELQTPLTAGAGRGDDGLPPIDDYDSEGFGKKNGKRWYHYLPLAFAVFLVFLPQPSLLYVLVHFYLLPTSPGEPTSPALFVTHLLCTYALTFGILTSLMVCFVRDPGKVIAPNDAEEAGEVDDTENEEVRGAMSFNEALRSGPMDEPDDIFKPGKWCRKCWAPKYERTHHCSQCGRCVLKMDHHCPWVGNVCIGHRTYPAFLHFLMCITLLSLYLAGLSINVLIFAFNTPLNIDSQTPLHALTLAFMGFVFAFVIGSFFLWHLWLVTTNQTTLESLSPFLLLRHLPPLPKLPIEDTPGSTNPQQPSSPSSTPLPQTTYIRHSLSDPPLEPELSYAQRRLVKDAHGRTRMYDLGWRQNWKQVFGNEEGRPRGGKNAGDGVIPHRWKRWIWRVICGGYASGDGKTFPRNPKAASYLVKLAEDLVKAEAGRW